MPNIPVRCMICEKQLPNDAMFIQHMSTAHGSTSPDQAMAQEKLREANLPKVGIPLDQNASPSPEFMEVAQMLDNPQPQKQPGQVAQVVTPVQPAQAVGKKLELKYKWEGTCPTCNAPVRTIVLKANGKTIAVAYCLTHEEVEQREVAPLERSIVETIEESIKDLNIPIFEEKEVENAKPKPRRRINVHKKTSEPDAVQPARMRESIASSVSGNNG